MAFIKSNIGTPDRLFRLIIGVALLSYGIWNVSYLALAGSAFVFFEVFFSWCAFYALIGKNSCPIKPQNKR
jgi:uncharacterized membrane protein YiaA